MDRRPRYYAIKIAVLAVLLAGGWAAFFAVGDSWYQLLAAVYLAAVSGQAAFLGHEAGHRQIFRSRRGNDLVGLVYGNLMIGLSFRWWTGKHNRHHAYPNQEGKDPDIAIPVLAFSAEQAGGRRGVARLLARYQAYLFFPMLVLEAVSMHVISIRAVLNGPVRRWRLEGLLLLGHMAGYLTAVFLVLSWPRALAFLAVQQGLFGLYLGCCVRPQPQGHAGAERGGQPRLPAPPGAHLPERQRRPPDRDHARRAQLPDRAPSVPVHAPAVPAPLPRPGAGVLCPDRAAVLRDRPGQLLLQVLRHLHAAGQ